MKRLLSILLCLCLLSGLWVSAAESSQDKLTIYYHGHNGINIATQVSPTHYRLYLPVEASDYGHPLAISGLGADADLSITYTPSDVLKNFTAYIGQEMYMTLTITRGSETKSIRCDLIPINGIATMYIRSDDPENEGREWIESSPDKSNSTTGHMLLVDEEGNEIYKDALTQIKGRGNSTWLAEKKPYQIKLSEKTDLLETGDKSNASKTWVLLTNHSDASQLRNRTVLDLAVAMGMDPGIQCRPINLFYDGEYRGTYLLCEKVEIKSGRVDIEDLEESIEESNPQIDDFDALPTEIGKTANGANYYYCPDLVSPENITGGFLLELDIPGRATMEKCYFVTTRGTHIVVKSPEYCSKEAMDYIATYYQEFEDALYNDGIHPENGKTLADYADIRSLAQCYIVNELTKNPDGYRTSCYFYKDADSDVLMSGPVWDYDLGFGLGWSQFAVFCVEPTGYFTLLSNFCRELYRFGPFRQAVHDIYIEQVSPYVTNTLLPALDENIATLSNAARGNNLVWNRDPKSFSDACATLKNYITIRNTWLTEAFSTWNSETKENMNPYHDVTENDWFYEAVTEASHLGLVNGMGFGIFAPEKTATRAQATKILWVLGGNQLARTDALFPDVDPVEWYAPAIAWAQESKIINGYADGNFGPNDPITRQDLVVLLYRWSEEANEDLSSLSDFSDGAAVSLYAQKAICWAIERGILTGYTDGTLRPKQSISRAELATIMVRYCNTAEK